MTFPTDHQSILNRLEQIDPVRYSSTRNHKSGALTYLGPYISRGVISTKQVFDHLLARSLPWTSIQKLLQELAWRDYNQQIWMAKGEAINSDLKNIQEDVLHHQMPTAILMAQSGISAIDEGIRALEKTGYMHNHVRMYVASLAGNIAKAHWRVPAQWMYSQLLDGDWASNAISWQWVVGSHSSKKYHANQKNINHFFESNQSVTYLDVEYDQFPFQTPPDQLKEHQALELTTPLPQAEESILSANKEVALYTYYNLDPLWRQDQSMDRILILEPSHFEKYPVNQKCIDFMLDLSKNIEYIQIFVGEFKELQTILPTCQFFYKEHPSNQHFKGIQDERDWMFPTKGYFPSFFKFWNKSLKQAKHIDYQKTPH